MTNYNGLITGDWSLVDLKSGKIGQPKNGLKVFSCFHCGGGSTMGYKLAGFDVLGGVEIDPEMMKVYRQNHLPKHSFLMSVSDFKNLKDLPDDLYNLDILDGSPPCSSFSMAGNRDKDWSKKKVFREGQTSQVLDDLFFEFIDIANLLKPKVIIAENVKGLILGNAKGYVKEIFTQLKYIGYSTQLFLLNSAFMGVPQARERTFFIAQKKETFKKLSLKFNEPIIPLKQALNGKFNRFEKTSITPLIEGMWNKTAPGKKLSTVHDKGSFFNWVKTHPDKPSPTFVSTSQNKILHWSEPRSFCDQEKLAIQSFPIDFVAKDIGYVCGMSVPPLMMQRIADQIFKQVF